MPGAFLALPAAEQTVPERVTYDCRFDRVCNETDCAATDHTLSFSAMRTTSAVRFSDPTVSFTAGGEEIRGGLISTARGHLFIGEGPGTTHLLTRAPDGAARYTRHAFAGPEAATWTGHCAETPQ